MPDSFGRRTPAEEREYQQKLAQAAEHRKQQEREHADYYKRQQERRDGRRW